MIALCQNDWFLHFPLRDRVTNIYALDVELNTGVAPCTRLQNRA